MGSHPPTHTVTVRVSMEVITSHDVEVLRTRKSYVVESLDSMLESLRVGTGGLHLTSAPPPPACSSLTLYPPCKPPPLAISPPPTRETVTSMFF